MKIDEHCPGSHILVKESTHRHGGILKAAFCRECWKCIGTVQLSEYVKILADHLR